MKRKVFLALLLAITVVALAFLAPGARADDFSSECDDLKQFPMADETERHG